SSQLFRGAGPIRGLYECARALQREHDAPAIWHPDRTLNDAGIEGQAREPLVREMPNPNVASLILDDDRDAGAVRRESRPGIDSQRCPDRRLLSVAVEPHERSRPLLAGPGDVD